MGIFTDGVTVQCSPQGVPVQLWWREQWWLVTGEPLCWYRRQPWWEQESRMPPGDGVGKVDSRIWRMQVSHNGVGSGQTLDEEPELTLDVVQQRPSNLWRVIKIHDAVDDVFKDDDSA